MPDLDPKSKALSRVGNRNLDITGYTANMPLLIYDKPHLSEIEPGLFIGDFTSSLQLSSLKDNGITAIVSLANNKSEEWSQPANRDLVPEAKHMFIRCGDSSTQDILVQLPDICDFIDTNISTLNTEQGPAHSSGQQNNVLVHCTAGVSRSATVVVAYLMRKHGKSLKSVIKQVKERRRIQPSKNFLLQLQIWEHLGYELWEDEARQQPKAAYKEFLEHKDDQAQAKAKRQAHRANSSEPRPSDVAKEGCGEQARELTAMYAHYHAQYGQQSFYS